MFLVKNGFCRDGALSKLGAEMFIHNGKETRIVYDYEGKICFKIVPF
jgi:hypothetical protein